MPAHWPKSLRRRARMVIDNIDGLTPEMINEVYVEWNKHEYEDTLNGHTKALSDLTSIALRKSLGDKIDAENARIEADLQAYLNRSK